MSSKAFYMAMTVIIVTVALVISSAMGFEMLSDNMRVGILLGVVGVTFLVAALGHVYRTRQLR